MVPAGHLQSWRWQTVSDSGVAQPGQSDGGVVSARKRDDDSVRELVARDFLEKIAGSKVIVFVQVDDDWDPSDLLLKDLSDIKVEGVIEGVRSG
jgi:hypothetical protein